MAVNKLKPKERIKQGRKPYGKEEKLVLSENEEAPVSEGQAGVSEEEEVDGL